MALPVGHAAVGLATAAVIARATQTEPTAALWIGAFVACGFPDLDFLLMAVGLKGPRYHRNASHSLLVLAGLSGVAWWLVDLTGIPLDPGVRWAWIGSLFSHPIVDYFTTGPSIRDRGFAIPFFWPISSRRYAPERTLFDSLEIEHADGWKEMWIGMRPEFTHLAIPAAIVIALTRVF